MNKDRKIFGLKIHNENDEGRRLLLLEELEVR